MKIVLTLVLLLTISSIGAFAAPVACLGTGQAGDTGSMAALETAMNVGDGSGDGCFIGDKWFTGFSATGFGADLSVYQVELNNLQHPPLPDFHGFTFLSAPGDFIGPGTYQIMYSVIVDPSFPLQFINAHSIGINVSSGFAAVTYDVTGVGAAITPLSAQGGVLTGPIAPPNQGPLTFTLDLTVGADRSVTEFEHQIFQETQMVPPEIPEPATYLMLGSGLLALALLRRRRATR